MIFKSENIWIKKAVLCSKIGFLTLCLGKESIVFREE